MIGAVHLAVVSYDGACVIRDVSLFMAIFLQVTDSPEIVQIDGVRLFVFIRSEPLQSVGTNVGTILSISIIFQ